MVIYLSGLYDVKRCHKIQIGGAGFLQLALAMTWNGRAFSSNR